MTEQQAERLVQAVEQLVTILASRGLDDAPPVRHAEPRFDLIPPKGRTDRAA